MDRHPVEAMLKEAEVQDRIPSSVKEANANRRLHSLLAYRLRREGHKVAGDLTIEDAIRCFGAKRYMKYAEWKMVEAGPAALENV
jgi:hypothetical protein